MLYVCGTPIGNLEDITFRALSVMKSVDLIAAEDTRHTRKLLSHFEISKPVVSYHEHNKKVNGPRILGSLLDGKNVALVTDAGMPAVSDPGSDLVRLAAEAGIRVVPVPGASAVVTALAASGIASEQFVFVGFLPRKKSALKAILQEFTRSSRAMVAYEAPHRLRDTLSVMAEILAERRLCIAREITKVHEEFYRGTVASARREFSNREVLGEITLVLDGASTPEIAEAEAAPGSGGTEAAGGQAREADLEAQMRALLGEGVTLKDAVKAVAERTGLSRNVVYSVALRVRSE